MDNVKATDNSSSDEIQKDIVMCCFSPNTVAILYSIWETSYVYKSDRV